MNEALVQAAAKPYAAMKTDPFSILSLWRGEWVFTNCFESESFARDRFDILKRHVGGAMVLRNRTEIIDRNGLDG